MGRQARATPEELARACKKLQADDNLTIHTLRHELGGGGAEYLTRGLREWRQQQREEARVPIEKMVSAAMRTALAEEMQRIRDETTREVHVLYAEDRTHLNFCLSELRRLEKEVEQAEATAAAGETERQRVRVQEVAESAKLKSELVDQRQRGACLAERFEDLRRQQNANATELALAREQREIADREREQEREARITEQQAASNLVTKHAEVNAELAAMRERCAQQQEMLQYMRADLKVKAQALEKLSESMIQTTRDAQMFAQTSARAEAALEAYRRGSRHHLIFRRMAETAFAKQQGDNA